MCCVTEKVKTLRRQSESPAPSSSPGLLVQLTCVSSISGQALLFPVQVRHGYARRKSVTAIFIDCTFFPLRRVVSG